MPGAKRKESMYEKEIVGIVDVRRYDAIHDRMRKLGLR